MIRAELIETLFMWAGVIVYALSAALHIGAVFFRPQWLQRWALRTTVAGFGVHAFAIGLRWVRSGHGPYLGFYEVSSLMAFISVGLLLWLEWRWSGFRVAGVGVMPVAFLMLGGAMLVSNETSAVSGALASAWLGVHVLFANLAYGSYLAAFALSAAYLVRDYRKESPRLQPLLDRLPSNAVIDGLTYRFVGAGFVFQGVMIASGAIWANEAWGRYWGWDPMETWSLIAWAIYAVYLHLRLTMGWKGRRAAWVAVSALPLIVFSLLGVPIFYKSIHGAYLYT